MNILEAFKIPPPVFNIFPFSMTKSILALGATAAIVGPSVKKAMAPKPKPKEYTVFNKPLGFDTGVNKTADRIAYKKFMDGTSAFKSPVKKTYKKT